MHGPMNTTFAFSPNSFFRIFAWVSAGDSTFVMHGANSGMYLQMKSSTTGHADEIFRPLLKSFSSSASASETACAPIAVSPTPANPSFFSEAIMFFAGSPLNSLTHDGASET